MSMQYLDSYTKKKYSFISNSDLRGVLPIYFLNLIPLTKVHSLVHAFTHSLFKYI